MLSRKKPSTPARSADPKVDEPGPPPHDDDLYEPDTFDKRLSSPTCGYASKRPRINR